MSNDWKSFNEEAILIEDEHGYLIQAVIKQDVKELKLLVAEKAGLCGQDKKGMTALMHAAAMGNMIMASILVEYEKGLRDKDGNMALHHALRNGHVDVAGLLLPHEDPRDRNGVTALMRAAAAGDMEMVIPLVSLQGAVQTISGGSYELETGIYSFNKGTTALMFAAYYGQSEVARVLVEREGGIYDNGRLTALMFAAERGYVDVVKELVPQECRLQNWLGRTALMFAARNGHTEVAKMLMDNEKQMLDGNGWTALMYAASNGYLEIASLMLECEKCAQDNDHWSALMFAAYYGYADMVKLLLDHERGLKDSKGRTALMHAAERGHVEATKLLAGYEAREQTNIGYTALMLAAYANCRETAEVLVHYEGGMQTTSGWTALMEAALYGYSEIIAILLKREGGMYRTDGCTALICAAYEGKEEAVKLLFSCEKDSSGWTELMYHATLGLIDLVSNQLNDVGQQDNSGITALIYAIRNYRRKVVILLAPYECGFQDAGGWTALMHATYCGHRELITFLLSEAGHQSISTHHNYCTGTTALMIAAQQNDAHTVKLLFPLEAGLLNCDGNCALLLALQNASAECIPLLLSELHTLDGYGKACYFKIHTLNMNESFELMMPYERLRETLQTMFFSQLQGRQLLRLLIALVSLVESSISLDHALVELVWSALLCEHNNAIVDLDNQLIQIEDECIDDACVICLARTPDCVLLPCRHLVICSVCADSVYTDKSCSKCPYCRATIETIFNLENCPSI